MSNIKQDIQAILLDISFTLSLHFTDETINKIDNKYLLIGILTLNLFDPAATEL